MASECYILFRSADRTCALARDAVRRILPLSALGHPPGCPAIVEGILDLAGTAVPVIRIDRLFDLDPSPIDGNQHLLLLNAPGTPLALQVDRATDVVAIPSEKITTLEADDTYNGCVVGTIATAGAPIHLLSLRRLLHVREHTILANFQAEQQRRLDAFTEQSA